MERGWLPCEAVEWVDVEWPGWIRVRLLDADGRAWFFVDKVPIFYADSGPGTAMPAPVRLACDVVGEDGGQLVVVPRWSVEAEDGTTRFRVRRDQLESADG
jgi:hypothetical protein